jgi:hypothetical protein
MLLTLIANQASQPYEVRVTRLLALLLLLGLCLVAVVKG